MIITLEPSTFAAVEGPGGPVASACRKELVAAGASIATQTEAKDADLFIALLPLIPDAEKFDCRSVLDRCEEVAGSMRARKGGRIVLMMSALAALPMRSHRRYSQEMAAAFAGVRAMAMEFGPEVLVNAIGLGVIEGSQILAGDIAQRSHVPLTRSGSLAEAMAALLFFCDPLNTYTSGQLLCVDGGWTAGFARDF